MTKKEPFTRVTEEDLDNAVTDIFGAKYSPDWKRLIKAPYQKKYTVKPGTKVICDRAFFECGYLTEMTLPDGLKEIGEYAFGGCESLIELTLPASLECIGGYVFASCCNCRKITSLAKTPARCYGSGLFVWSEKATCELVVPKQSITAYRQMRGWSCFDNIRGIDEDE